MISKYFLLVLIIIYFSACFEEKTGKIDERAEKIIAAEFNYDGKLNDSRVRLRDKPNLNSNTLNYLNINDEILIINKSQEKELIENMYSYWYQIRTVKGDEGWMYGYFLDINEESSYFIEKKNYEINLPRLSTLLNYKIDRINLIPDFSVPLIDSEVDSEIYTRLAGIYTDTPIQLDLYSHIELGEFSWGKDYDFGRGCSIIDFEGDEWIISMGGGVEYFKTLSVNNNLIKIDRYNSYHRDDKIELNDNYITFGGMKLYKLSGPDSPMKYLKETKKNRDRLNKKYKIIKSGDAKEILGTLPVRIFKIIKNNDNLELNEIISKKYGLIFKPRNWYKIDPDNINESYEKAISYIYKDLKYHYAYSPEEREPVIFYNEYMIINKEEVQKEFPNSICVEYYFNKYLTFGFIFVNENNIWKLACVINKCSYI